MRKVNKTSNMFWQIFISFIGTSLILIGVISLLLFFFGTTAAANVTTRRVGGADDGRPANQRYLWSVDYTFTDQKDVTYEGHTQKRGGDMSVKTDTRVYYFSFAPFINVLESEAKPSFAQPLYIGLGVLLIVVMNGKKKPTNRKPIKDPSELTDYDDSVEEQYHHDK